MAGGSHRKIKPKRLMPKSNSKCHSPMATSRSSPTLSLCVRDGRFSLLSMTIVLSVLVLLGISSKTWFRLSNSVPAPQIYSIEVVNEFPHDPKAFTQGLLYAGNDSLFESTGLYGQYGASFCGFGLVALILGLFLMFFYDRSSVRKVDLKSGKVSVEQRMASSDFGEGLTLMGDKLYQLTWRKKVGFIYDRDTLNRFVKFTHDMKDGWGLATDGNIFYGSDGSSTLYKINPHTLKVTQRHTVRYKDLEVHNLNELEFINGEVWANIWQTDCVARISPGDGTVVGWILLPRLREGLLRAGYRGIDVLNGIAWDSKKDRLFVTGKLWPKLYEIEVHPLKELPKQSIEELCVRMPFNF